MWIQSLGWEDPLKKGIATHSSILARGIPWTVEPGSPQSLGSQTPSQLTESMHALGHLYKVRGSWRTWTSETFQCTNSNFPSHLSRSLSTPNRTLTWHIRCTSLEAQLIWWFISEPSPQFSLLSLERDDAHTKLNYRDSLAFACRLYLPNNFSHHLITCNINSA